MLFCAAERLHINGMRSFSRDKLHYAKSSSFPYLGCKGSDTVVIMKWLRVLCGTQMNTATDQSLLRVVDMMHSGILGGLGFTQGIFGHGLWLRPTCVAHLRGCLQQFLASYSHLALFCVQRSWRLFGMVSKFHMLAHFKHDFEMAMRRRRNWTQNPCVYDCSMNEDMIGVLSRQSRRISYKHTGFEHTLLRHYLMRLRSVIKKHAKGGRAQPAWRVKRAPKVWGAGWPLSTCRYTLIQVQAPGAKHLYMLQIPHRHI